MDVALLQSYVEQTKQKKQTLKYLNDNIAILIEEPEDLEKEIIESEELNSAIQEKICINRKIAGKLYCETPPAIGSTS
jgi:uncharacterized protein (DUF342 family)